VCPEGHYCVDQQRVPCPEGTYNEFMGAASQQECRDCPARSWSEIASPSLQSCFCNVGFYDVTNGVDVECVACPTPGTSCTLAAVTLATLPITDGFWRWSNASIDIKSCSNEQACAGGNGTRAADGSGPWCRDGLRGPYCELCVDAEQYLDQTEQRCLDCQDSWTSPSQLVWQTSLVAVFLVAVAACALRSRIERLERLAAAARLTLTGGRARLKIIATTFQVICNIDSVYQATLPKDLEAILAWLDVLSVKISVFGQPECLGIGSFRLSLLAHLVGPPILLLLVLGVCLFRRFRRANDELERRALDRDGDGKISLCESLYAGLVDAMPWTLLVAFLVSPVVYKEGFSALLCETFGADVDDGATLLVADYEIRCSSHDPEYARILPLAWAAIAVYAVALPATFLALLVAAREAISSEQPTLLSTSLKFLHADYERRYWAWEICEVARKTLLIGFLLLLDQGSYNQLAMATLAQLVHLSFLGIAHPYRTTADNLLAITCSAATVIIFFLVGLLKLADLGDELGDSVSSEIQEFLTFDVVRITAIAIGSVLVCLVLGVGMIINDLSRAKQVLHILETRHMPTLSLKRGHRWHCFLSHIWSTAQDQCATIKRQLCLIVPNISVFLDVDDLKDIGALEWYVDATEVIMIFISKGYFKSKNCLREARCTVEKAKPLTLMHDGDKALLTIDGLKAECPAELLGPIFDGRDVIEWHRVRDFQLVSLKLLAEQILLGTPDYQALPKLPLFVPGELSQQRLSFATRVLLYASPNNPGAEEAAQTLRRGFPHIEVATQREGLQGAPTHMLLCLNSDTFVGELGLKLAQEVRLTMGLSEATVRNGGRRPRALARAGPVGLGRGSAGSVDAAGTAGLKLVLVHENDERAGGCAFARFFETTPQDLIESGLYTTIACAFYPSPFKAVSVALVANALGATSGDAFWPRMLKLVSCGRLGSRGKRVNAEALGAGGPARHSHSVAPSVLPPTGAAPDPRSLPGPSGAVGESVLDC